MRRRLSVLLAAASLALPIGCESGAHRAGDLTKIPTPAPLMPVTKGDLVIDRPDGYEVEPFAQGLDQPSGICFDEAGNAYVLESGGFLGENPGRLAPRIVKLAPDGKLAGTIELKGEVVFPATGILFHDAGFYVSHRDAKHLGVVSRVDLDGTVRPIVTGLPSQGDHPTEQLCIGPDGKLYFSQGSATNSGVVGVDDYVAFGWVKAHPEVHDIPAKLLILTGKNFATGDPRGQVAGLGTVTGAFKPFGVPCERGEEVKGAVKSNGSILRCDLDGKNLEVYAWGLRNPFGLAFAPDGSLHATCQGMDLRGSRPIAHDKDALLRVRKDQWYGWPDFTTDLCPLLDDTDHDPPSALGKHPQPLVDLAKSDVGTPSRDDVVTTFEEHASACGFAWAPGSFGKLAGRMFVAEFGSLSPATDPTEAGNPGCRVVVLDEEGREKEFLANDAAGPASRVGAMGRGLERPIDVKFGPDGALYVVDYGVTSVKVDRAVGLSVLIREGTGAIWRVAPRGRGLATRAPTRTASR